MTQQNTTVDKNILDVRKKRTASAKAVREFRFKQTSIGTSDIAYEYDLLRNFATTQINARLLIPIFIIAVAVLTAQWNGWVFAGAWLVFSILSHELLCFLSKQFVAAEKNNDTLRRWRGKFMASQVLISLTWCVLALSTGDGVEYKIIQFATILILQASFFMLSYAMMTGAVIMVVPATMIFATKFMMAFQPAFIIMSVTTIISALFFNFIARRYKESVLSMMEHKTEREMLIVELETEKSISEQARGRAEDANLAKSRFLATMSHELRTPLNAILGFSEIMRGEMMGPIDNPQYKEYVGDIHSSGSHLLKLINKILDISRIEAGRHDLKEEELKLVSVVDEARHMMNVKAEKKGVTLSTAYEENLPNVWVDEQSMRQVALNLISNALKFTPPGGTITVKVGWTAKGGQYLTIQDTGPGIPEEEIPIVLSSFGQGSIAIQNAEPGTGLGLTIVQALLHMHQGRFELRSKLREGTEAIAYIPSSRVMIDKSAEKRLPAKHDEPMPMDTEQAYAKAS